RLDVANWIEALVERSDDPIVALGGGSAIGLGKLVAARVQASLIAVPTTYSGAELTPFNAVMENGVKRQLRDMAMLPSAVIYDPDETLTLPLNVTGPSMMNAVAHAIEGLYAPEANPIVALKAAEAIRLAAGALPRVAQRLGDSEARAELMLSAMLAGEVLAVTSMGLHHKMCHMLGGGYGLPHASTNAVILPYAVAYNASGAPEAMRRVGAALGVATGDLPGALYDLAQASGAPASLGALGLAAKVLEAIARAAAAQTYPNPVALDAARLRDMLAAAWHGFRPSRA
ncbi:MAG: iron-containing alcohol dehydrogenase, partial [Hyphomicrobiaceae bacterium]|nr:iron-containing alcohol dehydrogenase [Hyphomicrobiaceae bacterium]